jgi:hypothetical protein
MRILLGVLLAFGALNAFAGGYYGMSGAPGVPVEWLAGGPFTSYVAPGLILFVVVGGTLVNAAVAVFGRSSDGPWAAYLAGTVVLGWMAVQVAIIGFVSWMQPITALGALAVIGLATWLRRSEQDAPGRAPRAAPATR